MDGCVLGMLGLHKADLALLAQKPETAHIHVMPMGAQLQPEALSHKIARSRHWTHVVAFRPTGWTFKRSGGLETRTEGNVTVYGIPYSEHSSFSELRACVAALRPKKVIPTVNAPNAAASRALVDRFADLMDLSADRSRLDMYFKRPQLSCNGAERPLVPTQPAMGSKLAHRQSSAPALGKPPADATPASMHASQFRHADSMPAIRMAGAAINITGSQAETQEHQSQPGGDGQGTSEEGCIPGMRMRQGDSSDQWDDRDAQPLDSCDCDGEEAGVCCGSQEFAALPGDYSCSEGMVGDCMPEEDTAQFPVHVGDQPSSAQPPDAHKSDEIATSLGSAACNSHLIGLSKSPASAVDADNADTSWQTHDAASRQLKQAGEANAGTASGKGVEASMSEFGMDVINIAEQQSILAMIQAAQRRPRGLPV